MIKHRQDALFLLRQDGTRVSFDITQLEAELASCFVLANIRDTSLAEDIALALELAMQNFWHDNKSITESEFYLWVVNSLEHSGYSEVATIFRERHPESCFQIRLNEQEVAQLLQKHLDLEGNNLTLISQNVIQSLNLLNVTDANPVLILELAKIIKAQRSPLTTVTHLMQEEETAPTLEQTSPSSETKNLSASSQHYLDTTIFLVKALRNNRSVMKIEMNLKGWIQDLNLTTPLTELCLMPHLPPLGLALEELIQYHQPPHAQPLSLHLQIPNSKLFINSCLGLEDEFTGRKIIRELIDTLANYLDSPIVKTSFL